MGKKQKQSYSKLQATRMKRSVRFLVSPPVSGSSQGSIILIGNQLREKLQRWLSPSDPSINQNIARKVHHEGTSTWFFQGGIFEEWKSTPSLLWIHGKRMSFLSFVFRFFVHPPLLPYR